MQISTEQLRTLTLAQAIERTDADRALVSQADLDHATRAALGAARQRGVQRVDVGDIVHERATAIVARASHADASVAALHQPSTRLRWLARGLPVLALLLGLAVDRLANAHRVDLLSPPLLLVLGWNLVTYCALAWRALRPRALNPSAQHAHGDHSADTAHSALLALRRWALPGHRGRAGRRGLSARIAADFHRQWATQTADLFVQRATRVLHLCAAAWAGGIALSLLLRGLFVRYQFGWESTFLDAAQVHAIVTVLFWPLTALFGLAPFSLPDITTTQDFAGQGTQGGRWVWMYVGLLVLVVVLPRLLLAAWAWWRGTQQARVRTVDLSSPAFDTLRQSLPGDLVVGLQAPAALAAAWRSIVAQHSTQTPSSTQPGRGFTNGDSAPANRAAAAAAHTDLGAVFTPQGDRLRFVHMAGPPGAAATIDALVVCTDVDADTPDGDVTQSSVSASASASISTLAQPTALAETLAPPTLSIRWADFAESWVLEPALFDQLATALPQRQHALVRLRDTWVQHNAAQFEQAMGHLAQHLHTCHRLDRSDPQYAARYAQELQALDGALRTLHGQQPARTPHGASPPASAEVRTPDGAESPWDGPHRAGTASPSVSSPSSPSSLPTGSAGAGSQGQMTVRKPVPRHADSTALALGTSAGAAAGAAAGAKMGAMIDLGTGGMTLGAGTALGALLGGTTAWVLRGLQKKEAAVDVLRHLAETACTHYLVIAHATRLPPRDAAPMADRWRAEVAGTVAVHEAALAAALRQAALAAALRPGATATDLRSAGPHPRVGASATATPAARPSAHATATTPAAALAPPTDALQAALHTLVTGILQRSWVTTGARRASATPGGAPAATQPAAATR